MRQVTLFMIVCAFGAAAPAKAQFLKNLTNNIKQTLQSRANGKTSQTTNQLLDKIDSATNFSGGKKKTATAAGATGHGTSDATVAPVTGGEMDTTGLSRVLGAFAKTAQENPNDTNQADLVMKSLARLTGGGGVSSQDSAAAISVYRSATGGAGYQYQTITTITSPKMGNTNDTMTLWLTGTGEGRSEIQLPIPGVQMGKLIVIGRAAQPRYSMSLDDVAKTYSLNIIDSALVNSGINDYQATRIGVETVDGYSCVHSRIVNILGKGAFESKTTFDVWTSTAVPGYSLFSKLMTLAGPQGGVSGSLARIGAGGFIVKMSGGDAKDVQTVTRLVRVQQRSFPATLFEIPAGYSNSETTMPQRILSSSAPVKTH